MNARTSKFSLGLFLGLLVSIGAADAQTIFNPRRLIVKKAAGLTHQPAALLNPVFYRAAPYPLNLFKSCLGML